jgi:hypothetical protein|tara:strand:+ start:84 stop:275 length:192 start_codon:yes stop_codon:yes gene_type:complete
MKFIIIYILGGLVFSFISEYTVTDEMLELNQSSRWMVRVVSILGWPAYLVVFMVQLIKGLLKR